LRARRGFEPLLPRSPGNGFAAEIGGHRLKASSGSESSIEFPKRD